MNRSRHVSVLSLAVLILFLIACVSLSPNTTNDLPSSNERAITTTSTIQVQTMTVVPTSTLLPTETSTVLPPTITSMPLPFKALDGLWVAYTINGNLFTQESGQQAVQLTKSGQDHRPIFSDDGQKIAFVREWATRMNEIHVINKDGTGEQVLVSPELLAGYYEATEPHDFVFIPGTHLLIFNTHYFDPHYPKESGSHSRLNYDLLLVDADTGELKQLKVPMMGGFFLISPNGERIAVQTQDHVDVIDVQGNYILHDLFSHSPDDYDCVFYGYVCAPMYWQQDSSELILMQPIVSHGGGPLARTVWRYSMDGSPGVETRLMPPPLGEEDMSISPDGNWIVFSVYDQGSSDGVYIGNLQNGTTQRIYQPATGALSEFRLCDGSWSPDSFYFVCHDDFGNYLVNIHGETVPLPTGRILVWIDNSHYLTGTVVRDLNTGEEIRVVEVLSRIDTDSFTFVLLKP